MVRKGLPDRLTSERGLKEGQKGVSPVSETLHYKHCRPSKGPRPGKGIKAQWPDLEGEAGDG